jgi:hypothetical protein
VIRIDLDMLVSNGDLDSTGDFNTPVAILGADVWNFQNFFSIF